MVDTETTPTNDPSKDHKLKVFISYSRDDMSFADELVAGLAYDGRYEVTIDRHSIIEGEDWKLRLGALIADADTIVFILSPASVASDICAWEVEEAHRHSKRVMPVLAVPVGAVPVPKRLAALNYVRFDPFEDGRPRSFMAGLSALVRALNTDASWLREHTHYLMLARSWDEAGRKVNRLLSGTDVSTAKAWEARHPKDAPQPTELHLDFIRASEEAETAKASAERQRLAEIDAAQQSRAEALAQAERANTAKQETSRRLVRRTLALGMVASVMLVALGGGVALYVINKNMQDKVDQTYISLKVAGSGLDYTLGHLQACNPPLSNEDSAKLRDAENLTQDGVRDIVNQLNNCFGNVHVLLPIIEKDVQDYRKKLADVPASDWAKELQYEIGPLNVLRSPDGRIYHPATSEFYNSEKELERALAK